MRKKERRKKEMRKKERRKSERSKKEQKWNCVWTVLSFFSPFLGALIWWEREEEVLLERKKEEEREENLFLDCICEWISSLPTRFRSLDSFLGLPSSWPNFHSFFFLSFSFSFFPFFSLSLLSFFYPILPSEMINRQVHVSRRLWRQNLTAEERRKKKERERREEKEKRTYFSSLSTITSNSKKYFKF